MDVRDPGRAKRALVVVCVAAAVLQLAFAPQFSILGGRFNFMVVLALVMAPSCDIRSAVITGFLAGLFYDLTTAAPVGLLPLILTIACFALSTVCHGMGGGFSPDSIRLFFLSALGVNLAYGIALYFMGFEGSLLVSLGVHGIGCTVLDTIASIPFFIFGAAPESSRGFSARGAGSRYKPYKRLK